MSDGIVIQKGILLPEVLRKGKMEFPFAEMEVGDSFGVPFAARTYRSIAFQANAFGKVTGRRFTVRRMKEAGETRCWRLQ